MDAQKVLSLTKVLKLPLSKMLVGESQFVFGDLLRQLRRLRKERFWKTTLNSLNKEDLFLSLLLIYLENQKGFSPQESLKMLDRAFIIVLLEDLGKQSATLCEECNGDGEETCPWCEAGYVDCNECVGGVINCRECDGSGEVDGKECEICNGTGNENCNHCDGEGYLTCEECGGSGELECGYCDGDGAVDIEGKNDFSLTIWITVDPNLKKYQVGESINKSEFDDIKNNSHLILYEDHIPLTFTDWPQVSGKQEIIVVGSTDNPKFFDSLVDTMMVDYNDGIDLDEVENFLLDYLQPGKNYFAE